MLSIRRFLLAPLSCLLLTTTISAIAGPEHGPHSADFPRLALGRIERGQRAVDALGARLPEVARAYGLQANQLRVNLLADASLNVDQAGQLLYVCPDQAPTALGGSPAQAAVPLSDTFLLHSRPGASKVIYLDFNGHTTSGTSWNTAYEAGASFGTPAYDIDGNAGSFSSAELARIQGIWQRVAEDYAPFDVDVTTQDPGLEALRKSTSTDTTFGVRVCIGGSSSDWYGQSAGGVAYVGSFSWNSDTPCFVFTAQLGGGDEKFTAEAASHEAGHTLGLQHDGVSGGAGYYTGHGSGVTGWAPIMGVGYYQPVAQWSRGEYANANNLQDDLTVIASYVGFRGDDHGNTPAAASYVAPGASFVATGVVSTASDVDVIAFSTLAGQIQIQVQPDTIAANLDVAAVLKNSAGTVIATSNPPDQLGASFNLSVPSGTYFIEVRGAGFGDPATTGYSSYGSLGNYVVSGTVLDATGSLPPVAAVTASTSSGLAPLAVVFDGSASFDQDGSVTGYLWTFDDGTTATGVSVSKTFVTVGNRVATLRVTDNSGLSATASVTIGVQAPNQLPTASFTSSVTSGTAPVAVSFDASGSRDNDGTIATYSWAFGDGTTGTGRTVQKTFSSAGTFTVRLTVTDDRGGSATSQATIQVSAPPAIITSVGTLSLRIQAASNGNTAIGTVRIVNSTGQPMSGVSVTGNFSGAVSGAVTATTDANGNATLISRRFRNAGTVTLTIASVVRSGTVYDPSRNVLTSVSVAAGSSR
jgi:PKD repeat protein